MRIILSGGGTAGHINPALALAEVLQKRGHEVLFAGTPHGVEARLVREAGIPFTAFEVSGFNRAHPLTLITAGAKTLKSTHEATRWLREVKPQVVVGFGGYVCIPVGRAAHRCAIPLVIHEQNSVMGLANRYLSKTAQAVAVTYEASAQQLVHQEKVRVTGNPVRKAILDASREQGREFLSLPADDLVLVVFGGSLGARSINRAITALKERLLACENFSIVQVTGPKEYEAVQEALSLTAEEQKRWKLFAYQDRMGDVLAAADLVVSRAGATSLAEISARCIPALLVPFPYATDDHQTTNAQACVERGAAVVIADSESTSPLFAQTLFALIEKPEMRETMKKAAATFATEDAAAKLADVVIAAAQQE